MISVEMAGRLGNQMFIYAYALSTSRRLKCAFSVIYNRSSPQDFCLPEYFACTFYRGKLKVFANLSFLKLLNRIGKKQATIELDSGVEPSIYLKSEKNWTHYLGYMQSERYFESHRDLIRKEFVLKKKIVKEFNEKYPSFLTMNKTVVLHCRQTDYKEIDSKELGKNLTLPMSYYERCLEEIENLETYQVYCVGDDLSEAERHFGKRDNFHFEKNEMMIDFQLIQAADIAIISNSTFAWWAAYLSHKPGVRVFAPKYWLGFKIKKEYPASIMSVNWNWVDF